MDILFDIQGEVSGSPVFTLTFNPEAMTLHCIGDMAAIMVSAWIRRSAFWNRQQFYPVLFELYGILYGPLLFRGNQGIGASLSPIEEFPLTFSDENSQLINLSFHCSRLYLQCIEEKRASNPDSNLTLGISFWTTMSLVPTTNQELGSLVPIKSRQGGDVNISRSHWQDMLVSIEYPQRRYIELPTLKPQEGAEELHKAIERLNQAHTLFVQDRYREAVQLCRQVRDVLLGEDKPTWAERVLAPIILDEKAAMINDSIKALNNLGHEASHGAGIEVDRDTASYVIGSLTLILDYIGRKMR